MIAGVVPGERRGALTRGSYEQVANQFALQCDQLTDTGLGQRQQRIVGSAGEWRAFGGALHFDEPAVAGHHHVHVHVGLRVFFVGEVEQRERR